MPVLLTIRQGYCNQSIMENCPFCLIAAHQLPANILYEDDQAIAIADLHPLAKVHILVIPKTHIASMNELLPEHSMLLSELLLTARKIAFEQGIGDDGYRLVINTNANGGQTIFHLHVHLLGGAPLGADLMTRGLR